MVDKSSPLQYLLILNAENQPLLFKIYRPGIDDLNIQLHCYACLDFLGQKIAQKLTEYIGQVYTVYTLTGEYSIFAYQTVTKITIFGILKNKPDKKLNEASIKDFFTKVYRLYKMELYQPFVGVVKENRFSKKFHLRLDSIAEASDFY